MSNGFKVRICSDVDYEELIAEIFIQEKYVALISQDSGRDNLVLEFPGSNMNEDVIAREVELDLFEEALRAARMKLLEGQV